MKVIAEKYLNSLCDIRNQNNDIVARGRITQITDYYLEVTYKDNMNVLLIADTIVKINIINETVGSKVYMGRVYVGSDTQIRLIEIVTLMDFEKRDYFRINIYEHALMFKTPVTVEEAISGIIDSYEITINNISLCGLFFLSTERFHQEEMVYIMLDLSIGKTVLQCKVHRISHDYPEKIGYGCEFVGLRSGVSDSLYRFIHQKQVEYIHSHR